MKTIFTLYFTLILFSWSFGQTRQSAGKLNINTAPRGIINEIYDPEPITIKGSYYLLDDWYSCNIILKNGQTDTKNACKYNLETSHLEIKIENEIRALNLRYIDNFSLYGEDISDTLFFENASKYTEEKIPLTGILEIIVKGKNKLISKPGLKKQQGNYIPALDVGEKAETYVKNEVLYFADGNKLRLIKGKKGEWLKELNDQQEIIKEYAKENKLGFRKKEHLTRLIRYCNTL